MLEEAGAGRATVSVPLTFEGVFALTWEGRRGDRRGEGFRVTFAARRKELFAVTGLSAVTRIWGRGGGQCFRLSHSAFPGKTPQWVLRQGREAAAGAGGYEQAGTGSMARTAARSCLPSAQYLLRLHVQKLTCPCAGAI